MAAAVPTTIEKISMGNKIALLATFGSAVGATDTWATGLANVEAVFYTDGAAGGRTGGATYSGGTVTFALSGALAANAKILAIGT